MNLSFTGVTIAELANIIKYIYSGKLFITKDSLDMTLEVCEMLELDEVIKGYKDSLLKNINTEKTVEKIEITGDKSVKEHRHLSSQAPAQTLGSDRIDKVVKESAGKRKVLEHVIDLSNEDDEIIIKIEDEDEYSTESSSAHRQKHDLSSDFYTAGGDHINTSSKAVTSISDTLVLERHSSSVKPAFKNKIMAKKLSQASLPTNLENTNSSKAEPQSKRTSSTTSLSVQSYKVPCLGSSRNEKQKIAEITSENHDHRDAAVYGGSLLLPDNLTEDLRASQVFSQTGERPFLLRREVTQTTSIQTPSEMKQSISPQNNLYVGNTEHIANANNQAQLPVYVFSGPVPKVNNPALKPLFAYTQVPVSSSVAIMTPRVSSKPGQSAEQPKQKSLNSSGKSAVPINVFRNISNIKGAILTAPMTESSVKKQSSTVHHMTSRIIGVNKSTMPTKLTLSDNEIGDISPSQTFVIPVQLKERAQVGIAKLGQNSGHENINLVKKEQSQTETTIYSPVTSNPCDKQLYCCREKEDNHIKACQRIDQVTINTKGGHYHLEENLADTVDNCSGTMTSSRTVTPNSLNSVESMGEYKPADKLAETHLQSHSPTDDLKPCNLVLDEVKTVPLSDNEYLNKTDRTGNVSRPSVNSRLVIKLSRISDQEVMRWTKRKSTDTHSTTKSTPADELTTRIDGSSEPPVKIRRSADLPEGVSRSSAR